MVVKNDAIFEKIQRLAQHYTDHIAGHYTYRLIQSLPLSQSQWKRIEEITSKYESYRYQGYHFDQLYEDIIALAHFVKIARTQAVPRLRSLLGPNEKLTPQQKTLTEMAIKTFEPNLNTLAQQITDLVASLQLLDREQSNNGVASYEKMTELKELPSLLS